jgi:cytochrome P450
MAVKSIRKDLRVMQTDQSEPAALVIDSIVARCPFDHTVKSQQKTARFVEPVDIPIRRDAARTWHIYGFEEARAIMRGGDTKQAGFDAEAVEWFSKGRNMPLPYLEGKPHLEQRKCTARFFTPKAVSANYRQVMERLADMLVADVKRKKLADLSQLSLTLAVRVAAEVVGLTNSRLPGMTKRLETFFEEQWSIDRRWDPLTLIRTLWKSRHLALFFFLDAQPAIRARRHHSLEDVISHLIAQGYSDSEILAECVTYAAAGMITTREFISVAVWHLLEQPVLRARYLEAPEEERYAILHEILRLEPIVGDLYRLTTADLHIESNGMSFVIPRGERIQIHIHGTNMDETIMGKHALELCPGRTLKGEKVPPMLMSFGDGHHRCPGAYLAMQETDIFLQRVLALDGLRVVSEPTISWNDLVTGYELRKFMIAVD